LIGVGMDGTKALLSRLRPAMSSTDNRLIVLTGSDHAAGLLLAKPERVLLRRSRAVFSASAPGLQIVSGLIDSSIPTMRAPPRAGTEARLPAHRTSAHGPIEGRCRRRV
jgi:hypothetical protein